MYIWLSKEHISITVHTSDLPVCGLPFIFYAYFPKKYI